MEVKALDLDGNEIRIVGKDLLAQALCHEIDHLNGVVFVDKVEPDTLEVITPDEKTERKNRRRKDK